ncbi:centromere/microtubule-binding protein cbf5 [Ophiocordyceps camponoti-floridani]|uniref:Derlin n=1 Tax=Ophiocordyceps camponoti-floridani TaxID=2030778 RepID=A0A8H4Q4Z0_9HYPO|nr:centromere/microtubule-binding protein cbf5 [Ophiocordyceps camponoti-floridani]
MADQWVEAYWRLPSVSRTMATAAFLTSVGVYTSLIPGYWIVFHPQFLWRFPPQIWRFFTAFLLTGPELSMLFDTYFVYSYLSQLEAGNPRFSRKEDLLWYLTFCGGTIMMMNYVSGLGFTTFLQALNLAMCYTVTQDQRGMKANLMFVTIPAPMTPFAMLAFNLLFPNGVRSMLLQLLGLLSAHLFDFLTRIWPEVKGGDLGCSAKWRLKRAFAGFLEDSGARPKVGMRRWLVWNFYAWRLAPTCIVSWSHDTVKESGNGILQWSLF